MGLSGTQTQTWRLLVCLSWMCVGGTMAELHYMVAVPAVIEAGAETQFCASLLQPNKNVVMTVTLISKERNTTLLKQTSSEEFHTCTHFQAPVVRNQDIQKFEVEVRGDTFYSKEVRKVMIKAYKPMTFVQTDKPIYLPGQTVHFRVITLDNKFRAASRRYNSIHIQDVNLNLIGQWQNKTSKSKILQLSYSLNSEAREGLYQIIVSFGKDKVYHSFKVEKYVLPKFDVKIEASDEVCVVQEQVQVKVCAQYTYGQPVPGNVEVEMCRPLIPRTFPVITTLEHLGEIPVVTAPCFKETKQTDRNGCATFTAPMSSFTKFYETPMRDHLHVKASMEEEGTGVSHPQEKKIQITYAIGKLSFMDTPNIYHQGVNIEGKVKALYHNNTPIADMKLYLLVGEGWWNRLLSNLTTDGNGVATFSVSTESFRGDVHLHIHNEPTLGYRHDSTPYYETGYLGVSLAQVSTVHTKSVSSLEVKKKDGPLPCDREEEIFIHYTVVGEKQGSVHVMYLVLSRGAIIMHGFKQIEVQDQSVNEGEVSFKLTVTPDSAPHIQVLAYAALSSEIVMAHRANFSTEKCFGHKVSLEFSPSSAVPGEETTLQLTAQPNSLCGVSAVDQSVLIKEPGKTLTTEKIFDLLPVTRASYIPYEVWDPVECLNVRPRRYLVPSWSHPSETDDAHAVFQNVGMKMATNLVMRIPSCFKFRGITYHRGLYGESTPQVGFGSAGGLGGGPYHDPSIIVTARSFFPETWIWDLVEVGETGEKDVSFTVPDTITTWETEAFCLSPQGFGLAPRKEITVFQPFFLELTLPYSIIRGEHFELKATVFNYLSRCIMVTVTPAPSLDYTLTPLSSDQYTSCLCGSERKTLRWTMVPSSLGDVNVTVSAEAVASQVLCGNELVNVPDRGRIDVVTRSLIVKAEGTELTKTHNWLLCPKGEALTEEVDLHLPENVIDGSARASLSVLGDILGRALENLDGLLQMPYGCGEQNMALLAPNIYILQYLKNTQQLTPAILEKATNFLSSGYQRQLNYKHSDGAYSAFGRGAGNTWLTAFVMRCFAKAQSFTFIDPAKIQQSKTWLLSKQQTNGCFQKSGKLFHNQMKGGVSDEVTLSAYITASFLEMNMSVNEEVMKKSLSCLKESISDLSNTYTTALLAYVFTLAGDMETRGHLLQHLDTVAVKQGRLLHWSQTAADTSASLSVEISSYVMLAKLSASPSTEDLGYASGIVRWLTSQQNHYGGFSSTQDTVVALQALALYSTLVFSPEGASTVTVQSPSGQLTFDVNHNNKLLYQEKTLPDVTGKYSLEVKGTACAAMQISLHYNIPTPTDITTLSVEVQHEAVCTSRSQRPKLTLKFKSLYSGEESTTNMVILDIKMLSGFVPDPESLKRLGGALLVDRVEQKQDHVMVYIRELPKDTAINHSLEVIQELPVQNLKPAVVKIYDYYQPSDQAETEYMFPCSAGDDLE